MSIANNSIEMLAQAKLAAFFLWEYTGHNNTLELWRCAEEIASFMDRSDIQTPTDIWNIATTDRDDIAYISFVRYIAYKIYSYTKIDDADFNWFTAEKLLQNKEWRNAVSYMSRTFRAIKENKSSALKLENNILSASIKNYYNS